LVVVLCISVVLLVVAARQWGALVAAIGSVVLYFAEFLIAREMRRRGTW
jgi:HAMP domain-containing protein